MSFDPSIGVVALVPDDWADTVVSRHHVLRRLATRFPVVWLEPAPGWREFWLPSGRLGLRPDRWQVPLPGLQVLSPGWHHPRFERPRWMSRAMLRSRLSAARRRLLGQGATRIVLYLWRDQFAEALDLVEHDASCYHVDDEYTFDADDQPNRPHEVELLRRVDQVIVHSPALLAKKGGINRHTEMIPNGVDFARYSAPQLPMPDIAAIPRPRIGYAGVIKKQLDLALLVGLAHARPSYAFVLVGPVLNVEGKQHLVAQLRKLPNVHFLGSKTVDQLPAYVQHFDVCLMCYEVNDYTKYIFPLKLNEYLATGLPTVSSPLDAVICSGAEVTFASGPQEWLDAVDAGMRESARAAPLRDARRRFARLHEWDDLVERIAELIRGALVRARQSPATQATEQAPPVVSGNARD